MDWKTWKNEKILQGKEKSGNFEQTGKMREFYPKYWKSEEILASFYFYRFPDFLIKVYLIPYEV